MDVFGPRDRCNILPYFSPSPCFEMDRGRLLPPAL